MENNARTIGPAGRIVFGFVAGFFATLIFHQAALTVMWAAGLAPFAPFSMKVTHPFMVPAVISLALWGGIWGVLFAFIERAFPRGGGYWIASILFGGIFPSAFALMLVLPLKGLPMGGGWQPGLLLTVFVVNAAWGVGTALILKAFAAVASRRHREARQ